MVWTKDVCDIYQIHVWIWRNSKALLIIPNNYDIGVKHYQLSRMTSTEKNKLNAHYYMYICDNKSIVEMLLYEPLYRWRHDVSPSCQTPSDMAWQSPEYLARFRKYTTTAQLTTLRAYVFGRVLLEQFLSACLFNCIIIIKPKQSTFGRTWPFQLQFNSVKALLDLNVKLVPILTRNLVHFPKSTYV